MQFAEISGRKQRDIARTQQPFPPFLGEADSGEGGQASFFLLRFFAGFTSVE